MRIKNTFGLLAALILIVDSIIYYTRGGTHDFLDLICIVVIVFLVLVSIFYRYNKTSFFLILGLCICKIANVLSIYIPHISEHISKYGVKDILTSYNILHGIVLTVPYFALALYGFSKAYDKFNIDYRVPIFISIVLVIINLIMQFIYIHIFIFDTLGYLLLPIFITVTTLYIDDRQLKIR